MLLSLTNVKQVLKLSGISNLSVKFEPIEAFINVNFVYKGKNYNHRIGFQDIEQAFSEGDSTQQGIAGCKNMAGGGIAGYPFL
jgi:hypothetical protein